MEEDWDYLIILDACRYDYFAKLHHRYLEGSLDWRTSLGSCTPEWLLKTFTGVYKDVVYVSANPYINSVITVHNLAIKDRFLKIIDVWLFGWDDFLGTVLPSKVNEAFLSTLIKFSDKRIIVHYLQPHAPYLSNRFRIFGFSKPNPSSQRFLVKSSNPNPIEVNLNKFVSLLFYFLRRTSLSGYEWALRWWLRELLGLSPESPMDAVRRKFGVNGLRQAYTENLLIVLKAVSEIIPFLSGKIIITSDHGEFLGEGGRYGHPYGCRDPILTKVPWFEVKKVVYSASKNFKAYFKDIIRRRAKRVFKKLKYV